MPKSIVCGEEETLLFKYLLTDLLSLQFSNSESLFSEAVSFLSLGIPLVTWVLLSADATFIILALAGFGGDQALHNVDNWVSLVALVEAVYADLDSAVQTFEGDYFLRLQAFPHILLTLLA